MSFIKPLLVMALMAIPFCTKAQATDAFEKGNSIISVGYGVPNVTGRTLYYFRNDQFNSFGPIYGRYEYGITDVVGISFQASFSTFSFAYENSGIRYKDEGRARDFQLQGNYHFHRLVQVENLDLYGTLGLGMWYLDLESIHRKANNLQEGEFHLSLKGGARYYLTPNIAGYVQLGFDKMSAMDFGVSVKF